MLLLSIQALGLEALDETAAQHSSLAASVNQATCDAALRLAPAPARERYERRGRRLHFAPDRRALRVVSIVLSLPGSVVCHAQRDRCGSRSLLAKLYMRHMCC